MRIDIKRRYIDIGRKRYILHVFDMEPWREEICPICNVGFVKKPTYFFAGMAIHNECSFTEKYDDWVKNMYKQMWEDEDASIS